MAAQVFKPIHNMLARVSIIGGVLCVGLFLGMLDVVHRSPVTRLTKEARPQPVPFSHKHHTNLGIDCRYCHTSVEDSSFAGIPPTKTCMNCHNLMWNEAEMLAPVRDSMQSYLDDPAGGGESIEWTRVHDMPDFVYFNHSIHVNKGVGCEECHGRVDEMPLMYKEKPLFMKWCLDCHRDPAAVVRPKELVTRMGYDLQRDFLGNPELLAKYGIDPEKTHTQREVGEKLVEHYRIDHEHHRLTNCWICHR